MPQRLWPFTKRGKTRAREGLRMGIESRLGRLFEMPVRQGDDGSVVKPCIWPQGEESVSPETGSDVITQGVNTGKETKMYRTKLWARSLRGGATSEAG